VGKADYYLETGGTLMFKEKAQMSIFVFRDFFGGEVK